ncbi:MAG TPA: glutathione synthase [Thiotrichaceae bacterium]|jgi:glutathione synthase|nr:glutathione synthase [Thiotrichaceae bacterium]HIM07129.1 glutathione synthase [Gammaproteobacteria bacterium]
MKIGIIMDPISGINIKKDSSFAMLLAAQKRGWELNYMEMQDLYINNDVPMAKMQDLQVEDKPDAWFTLSESRAEELASLDIILMRKDPPFDLEYIYSTYILEHAERLGTLVVNSPAALRDANEKMFITHFADCIAPTHVSRNIDILMGFIRQHKNTIIKPLDGMAGQSIFRVNAADHNCKVILETMTNDGTAYVMAQKFLPEISAGDKRILLIDGKPVPYALARIPADGEVRGNLARGGTGKGVELSDRDRWICEQIGPRCREMGLLFVGVDVIGDYLTEINVTSPTCIRELDSLYNLDIAGQLMDALEKQKRSI